MRRKLEPYKDQKAKFTATVGRFGLKPAFRGGDQPTMLLKNIVMESEGERVAIDHAWVTVGKTIAKSNPKEGDRIEFNAWIKPYHHWDREIRAEIPDIGINRVSAISLDPIGSGQSFLDFWKEQTENKTRFTTNKLDDVLEEYTKTCLKVSD